MNTELAPEAEEAPRWYSRVLLALSALVIGLYAHRVWLCSYSSAHALPACAQYEALAPHNLSLCAILLVVLVTICLFRVLPEEPERGARGAAQESVKEVKKA